MEELKVGDEIKVIHPKYNTGEKGIVTRLRDVEKDIAAVKLEDGVYSEFNISYLQKIPKINHDEIPILSQNTKNFTKIATEIGEFTDKKNLQYGSSVEATSKMIHVLLERYTYDEGQYLIPRTLVDHILLQSRMMDKQNRIFNNPSGEGDSESPYVDLCGYSLIGVDMVKGVVAK